jgi:hypothetical protein
MPKRQFHDATGASWDVWDVRPSDAARSAYDRRGGGRESSSPETPLSTPSLDPLLENGWLCFQAGHDRRRFAPIPPGWWELPDGVLRVMLEIANPVVRTSGPTEARPGEVSPDR